MVEQITLYTAKVCPYAHRVELALEEAGATYDVFHVDLANKPEWYAPKVNPASKVPAIAYGGPKVAPDQPSPESVKINESLVLVEFVSDLYPNANLFPKDPVQAAKARLFIDAISNKVTPAIGGFSYQGEPVEKLYTAIETLQSLLVGKWALGDEFSAADIAIAPFLGRLDVVLKNGLTVNGEEGKSAYSTLQSDAKYAKFREYFANITSRDSFKKTFQEEVIIAIAKKRLAAKA